MKLTPFDVDDLARILHDEPDALIDEFPNLGWISQVDEDLLLLTAKRGTIKLRLQLASSPYTAKNVLLMLLNDNVAQIRRAAAGWDQFEFEDPESNYHYVFRKERFKLQAVDDLRTLSQSRDLYLRLSVCLFERTPSQLLEILSTDDAMKVRAQVAQNLSSSPATLERLATDMHVDVRAEVAKNSSTPVNCLYGLMQEPENEKSTTLIHRSLAENPAMPSEILEKLATSSSLSVRASVATNQSLNKEILERLARDRFFEVRSAAASNTNLSQKTLSLLARDSTPEVRRSVANNPRMPEFLIQNLLEDPDRSVRYAIAKRPNLQIDDIRKMRSDPDELIRKLLVIRHGPPALDGCLKYGCCLVVIGSATLFGTITYVAYLI